MRIEAGRLLAEVDEAGRLTAVAVHGSSDRPLLDAVDVGVCRVDGDALRWAERQVSLDSDEVGVRLVGGDLEVGLRHSFGTVWTTRLVVVNTGAVTRTVDRLQLSVQPATGHRVSALVAGSRLCWALHAVQGEGVLLTARLLAGAVSAATLDGFELGRIRLAPGQRYVTQLRWELFATPRSVVSGPGRDVLVARTVYDVEEAVLLPEDPDAALVVPRDVVADAVDEPGAQGTELSVGAPGRYRVELRSADGDVRLDLSWVEPLDRQLASWAAAILAGRRSSAGVVTLDGVAAGVVLQAALGGGGLEDAELAGEALDRQTALLLDRGVLGVAAEPMTVLYLLAEHGRTGEPDVLDLALALEERLLAGSESPPPGLGLVVLRTVLAGIGESDRVAPLVRRAVERATALAEIQGSRPQPSGEQAAELELLLAVRPLLPPDHPAHERLLVLIRALGAALGAGLPGRLVAPPQVAEHAHLVAVLRLLPEDGSATVTRSWGAAPTILTHRLTLEVLDRLTSAEESPVGPEAAWLALGQRHA